MRNKKVKQKQIKTQIEFYQKKLRELYRVENLSDASFKNLSEKRVNEYSANEKELAMAYESKIEILEEWFESNKELSKKL